ncbi:MAG: hydroxymethylglutaryl-CoA lyase [Candidatus Sericytochromatia bacterium]|nr:hydroxymethylglutaryl-CoA lyase [Candidatus Tanganyikabacteria bacterium]
MTALPDRIRVVEVGPRDGLQNEAVHVPTDRKVRLVEALGDVGLSAIEMTAFVHPRWIPQMADASEVATTVRRRPGVRYSALVPNVKGYAAAAAADVPVVAVFMSATETHSRRNLNKGIDEAIEALREVTLAAQADGREVRAYLSVVFGCPYEGEVAPTATLAIAKRLASMGIGELSLGDTTGMANPTQVRRLVSALREEVSGLSLAGHFHDTRGTALANTYAAMLEGLEVFDASVGGLGGCPYAPGASGNLSTNDLVAMLEGMGIATGVDRDGLLEVTRWICQDVLGVSIPSREATAELARRAKAARVAAERA